MSASKVAAWFFDLDGTLVESLPGIAAALAGAFRAAGRELPTERLRAEIGPPIRVIARRLAPGLSDDETLEIERAYRQLYDGGLWRESRLFAGAAELLQKLEADGALLFVVTNKPRLPAMAILEDKGLLPLMSGVMTRDSCDPPYADKAEMLVALLERHGLSAAECVMVGDTQEDAAAARQVGMTSVHMTHGYGSAPEADVRCESFAELGAWDVLAGVPAAGVGA